MVNLVLHNAEVGAHNCGRFGVKIPAGHTQKEKSLSMNAHFSYTASLNLYLKSLTWPSPPASGP